MKKITDRLYQIPIGPVNAYLLDAEELILIDTGYKGKHSKILEALHKLNKNPGDIKHILLTHSHPDHAGALADLVALTGARTYMHEEDATLMKQGLAGRLPFILSPGLINKLIFNLFMKNTKNENDVVVIDQLIQDNELLPLAGGIRVIHVPGHSLGQVCFLLESENLLVVADICSNMFGLGWSVVYEDRSVGLQSIKKATSFKFDIAVFGHGNAIRKNAAQKISAKFS